MVGIFRCLYMILICGRYYGFYYNMLFNNFKTLQHALLTTIKTTIIQTFRY